MCLCVCVCVSVCVCVCVCVNTENWKDTIIPSLGLIRSHYTPLLSIFHTIPFLVARGARGQGDEEGRLDTVERGEGSGKGVGGKAKVVGGVEDCG